MLVEGLDDEGAVEAEVAGRRRATVAVALAGIFDDTLISPTKLPAPQSPTFLPLIEMSTSPETMKASTGAFSPSRVSTVPGSAVTHRPAGNQLPRVGRLERRHGRLVEGALVGGETRRAVADRR